MSAQTQGTSLTGSYRTKRLWIEPMKTDVIGDIDDDLQLEGVKGKTW